MSKTKTVFIGRKEELNQLAEHIKNQKKVQMIVCYGRRRIGKSQLIREFAKTKLIEVQGLAPAKGLTNENQIDNFINEFNSQMNLPKVKIESWRTAFQYVSYHIANKKIVLFLDEISWMGHSDVKFTSVLKQTFDTEFQKNKNLTIVICGSVSSWISENILNATDFVGRITLDINLHELKLNEIKLFFDKNISTHEILFYLLHTGGVPRYLNEYRKNISVESLISQLSFNKTGVLFQDFDRIFNDIFLRRSKIYKEVVLALKDSALNLTQILKKIKKTESGKYSGYMRDLEMSGFVKSFEAWDIKYPKKRSKNIYYRIVDNYLRFYIKQVEPNKSKILNNIIKENYINQIKGYDVFLGFQFENLIINNIDLLIQLLKINVSDIIKFGPYIQNQTTKQMGCQIDYLIQTKHLLYVVEIKNTKKLSNDFASDVESKIKKLTKPKFIGIKKVLIHTLKAEVEVNDELMHYFDYIISFEDFLTA